MFDLQVRPLTSVRRLDRPSTLRVLVSAFWTMPSASWVICSVPSRLLTELVTPFRVVSRLDSSVETRD